MLTTRTAHRALVASIAAVLTFGACGGESGSQQQMAAPRPTEATAPPITSADGGVLVTVQGHGIKMDQYETIAEMAAKTEFVVRAVATDKTRNATIYTRDTKLTTMQVVEVLRGNASLLGPTIEIEQNRIPLHEDFPFAKAGSTYLLFLVAGHAPEEGGKATYGVFGMYVMKPDSTFADLDPDSARTAPERQLSLDALRAAVRTAGG